MYKEKGSVTETRKPFGDVKISLGLVSAGSSSGSSGGKRRKSESLIS